MTTSTPKTIVRCPTCGKRIIWSEQERWRPFCSHRCRLIDLGMWADGSHRIPGEAIPTESYPDQPPGSPPEERR